MKMNFVGVGVYHAGPGGIEKPGDFGYRIDGSNMEIALRCPKFGVCLQKIHQAPADHSIATWNWDGNVENPTIRPSIGCDMAPRCGQHMTITAGDISGNFSE